MSSDDFGEGAGMEASRDSISFMKLSVKRDERAYVYLLLATFSKLELGLLEALSIAMETALSDENNDNAHRLYSALKRLHDALRSGQGRLHDIFDGAGYQLYPQERVLLSLDLSIIADAPAKAAELFSSLSAVLPAKAV